MSADDSLWDQLNHPPFGRPMYYDRAGNGITLRQWVELRNITDYIIVAKTEVGDLEVSTVWLGIDHSFLGGPPIIFETMIFQREAKTFPPDAQLFPGMEYHEALDEMWRYSTETDALNGHQATVEMLRATLERQKAPGSEEPGA